MVIDAWHQWMAVYAYDFGQFLFFIGLGFSAISIRKPALIISAIAFLVFIIGNLSMYSANQEYMEMVQRLGLQSPMTEMLKWRLGRIASSVGFFVSSLGMLCFGISTFRQRRGNKYQAPQIGGTH